MLVTSSLYYGTFTDNLAMAGEMTLLGLATVFLVLAILWGVMVIFKILLHDLPAKRAAAKAAASKPESAPAEVSVPAEVPAVEDNGQLIAVLAAAVAAYRAAEGAAEPQGFRVVSFKRSKK